MANCGQVIYWNNYAGCFWRTLTSALSCCLEQRAFVGLSPSIKLTSESRNWNRTRSSFLFGLIVEFAQLLGNIISNKWTRSGQLSGWETPHALSMKSVFWPLAKSTPETSSLFWQYSEREPSFFGLGSSQSYRFTIRLYFLGRGWRWALFNRRLRYELSRLVLRVRDDMRHLWHDECVFLPLLTPSQRET